MNPTVPAKNTVTVLNWNAIRDNRTYRKGMLLVKDGAGLIKLYALSNIRLISSEVHFVFRRTTHIVGGNVLNGHIHSIGELKYKYGAITPILDLSTVKFNAPDGTAMMLVPHGKENLLPTILLGF